MMVHTALTENPTKKPTIFASIQTTCHQSLKKSHDQLKKDSLLSSSKIFFRSEPFTMKNAQKTGYKTKLQYPQPKENKAKGKENVTLFGSIHLTASPLKAILGEYS